MNFSEPSSTTPAFHLAWLIAASLVIGVVLRLGVILAWPEKLLVDTDAYLAYATAWSETGTFGYDGRPTAYRPPMYPWLLSLLGHPTAVWIAAINMLSGTGAILCVWLTARSLGMPPKACFCAALLMAIDPLLLLYAGQAMTESLCTFESALLLLLVANMGVFGCAREPKDTSAYGSLTYSLAAGFVVGLSVLTRPTFLVFGVLTLLAMFVVSWLAKRRPAAKPIALLTLGFAIPVGAWGVRNQMLLGTPVITTTHGGYTLLLGNNANYYRDVVEKSHSTEWAGVQPWSEELNRKLNERNLQGEVARDRAMRDEAIETILRQPGSFLHASLLRFLNFWAVTPGGESQRELPMILIAGVGLFYALWWLLSGLGLLQVMQTKAMSLMPAICLIAAFASVHTIYWSNARMRAPVLPALALLAAFSVATLCTMGTSRSAD